MRLAAFIQPLFMALAALVLTACATGPEIRTDFDPEVDFGQYETFDWVDELYTAWPYYDFSYVNTVRYKVGTANVDVIDADRRQLIWEGVAEERLTGEQLENPGEAIGDAVKDLFRQFPTRRER